MAACGNDNTICLVDGSGYIFRAFYALPMMTRPDGTPVNAVYGFLKMLMQLIEEQHCAHIVVVFDAARRNFRNDIYPAYKQTRKEVPAELIPQFPLIRTVCRVLNIPQIELEGFEADDIIATYTRIARDKGWQVRVISADKDLMQLIRDGVQLYDPMKRKIITQEDVSAKFGVTPDKVIDVQSLMGDSIDNVPGASGIGPKTAAELINQFGSLEGIYTHLSEIKSEKRREGLLHDKEQVFISQQLVRLNAHTPVQEDLSLFKAQIPNKQILLDFLTENNFKSLIPKIQNWLNKQSLFLTDPNKTDESLETNKTNVAVELPLFETQVTLDKQPNLKNFSQIELVQNKERFQKVIREIQETKNFSFQFDEENTHPTGMAVYVEHQVYYIPLAHKREELDLFALSASPSYLTIEDIQSDINLLFSDSRIHKISFNIKNQLHILDKNGITVADFCNYDDVLLQNYVLNGSNDSQDLIELSQKFLDMVIDIPPAFTGKKAGDLSSFSMQDKAQLYTKQVRAIYQLYQFFQSKLNGTKQNFIYQSIELPLIFILFKMEKAGILIDKQHLEKLNIDFTQEINQLLNQIFECAGEEFNVNSPAQIGHILFEKMGLSGGKKGSNGNFSTDVKVLEKLAEEGVEIASLILKYRLFVKLKSTYIDSLLKSADKNGRVHTTFLQTVTNTGRLSSVDPNLQNIPIRTTAGKEIRRAFIARPGYKIVCADYSQIELRLMADVANVVQLKDSFSQNEDIHARTASQIFKIPLPQIDVDTRRQAKAINFSIIYGISAFGLSNRLGIPRSDAKNYIDSYFLHYPEIKTYMKNMENAVKQKGYVETSLGRICFIPGAQNPKTASFAVRAAINAPIQGGAADIIKLAMKEIDEALTRNKWDATLLLQVHDELVLEVKDEDVNAVMKMVKDKMESAVSLSVPLIADVRAAHNWKEAH